MRRILFLAAAIGLGLTQGARAADMSVHAASPFFLPPVNSTPDWSGPYLGFNGGLCFWRGSGKGALPGAVAWLQPPRPSPARPPPGGRLAGAGGPPPR